VINQAKRVVVAVVGFAVLLVGVAMLVLPGPALIVIPVGLGILATQFTWARILLQRVKAMILKNGRGGSVNETK
jgi:tellurite resistance protein TerC